jgi:hypothetical protein
MDPDMQHVFGHTAWIWAYGIDLAKQHGHRQGVVWHWHLFLKNERKVKNYTKY